MEQKYQSRTTEPQERNGNKIRNGDLSRTNIESHPLERSARDIWGKSPFAASVGRSECRRTRACPAAATAAGLGRQTAEMDDLERRKIQNQM
jgi:hypothetical protein